MKFPSFNSSNSISISSCRFHISGLTLCGNKCIEIIIKAQFKKLRNQNCLSELPILYFWLYLYQARSKNAFGKIGVLFKTLLTNDFRQYKVWVLVQTNRSVAPSTGEILHPMRHWAWRGCGTVHMPRWMQNSTSRWLKWLFVQF